MGPPACQRHTIRGSRYRYMDFQPVRTILLVHFSQARTYAIDGLCALGCGQCAADPLGIPMLNVCCASLAFTVILIICIEHGKISKSKYIFVYMYIRLQNIL